jgi:hypothetical protein
MQYCVEYGCQDRTDKHCSCSEYFLCVFDMNFTKSALNVFGLIYFSSYRSSVTPALHEVQIEFY